MGVVQKMRHVPEGELLEAFKFFDSNSDGALTKEEFATMIRSLGQTPSKLELNVLLKDHAMDDNIHWDTVKSMLDTIYTYTAKRDKAKLMDAFKVFDPDGTGKVSYETFEKEILVKIGEPMDEKEVADTLKNLAESGAVEGDEIRYDVFVDWIMDQLQK